MSWNVLVVDDSATIRGMVSKALRLGSIPIDKTFEAANGKEALHLMRLEDIDVALVDVHMPIMDGVQLVQEINSDPTLKGVSVVLLTSEGRSERIEKIRSDGIWEYLRKPVTPERVQQVITELAHRKGGEFRKERWEELFCDVVQKLGFVVCEVVDKAGVGPEATGLLASTVTFGGARRGELTLAVREDTAVVIAGNVLGVEPCERRAKQLAKDALAEVSCVACSHYLTSLFGEGPVFDLESPQIRDIDVTAWHELATRPDTMCFRIEDDPALVRMRIEDSVE